MVAPIKMAHVNSWDSGWRNRKTWLSSILEIVGLPWRLDDLPGSSHQLFLDTQKRPRDEDHQQELCPGLDEIDAFETGYTARPRGYTSYGRCPEVISVDATYTLPIVKATVAENIEQ